MFRNVLSNQALMSFPDQCCCGGNKGEWSLKFYYDRRQCTFPCPAFGSPFSELISLSVLVLLMITEAAAQLAAVVVAE
jgi:hypothetical protein